MKQVQKSLALLGLDEKEIAVYLACTQFGSLAIAEIVRRTEIIRTTVNDIVDRLQKRKMLLEERRGKRHVYAAVPPQEMKKFLVEREQRAKEQLRTFEDTMPQFLSLFNAVASKPRVRFYEGREEIITAMNELLESKEKMHYHIVPGSIMLRAVGQKPMEKFVHERIRRKIRAQGIRVPATEIDQPIFVESGEKYLREFRYAPANLIFPLALFITDNKVVAISSEVENYALVIESDEFATLMKSMFAVLWSVSAAKTPAKDMLE